jgi:nucleoside-diphosphate-sugar epimerase
VASSSHPSVALVTGATGLVGSHIVDRLLADGWSVRALSRTPDRARASLPRDIDVVAGDILDEASFVRAAAGCHVVFHAAANITVSGGWETYRLTNVEGTRIAVLAAERAKARLLHVSSVAVYGPKARYEAAQRGERTDEDIVLQPIRESAYYARSKRESEELVLGAHSQGRVWATAVRPAVVYGRRDRQFVPRMAVVIKRGVIPLLHGGRSTLSVVHAANVAEGAVLAATSDNAGGRAFNLAHDHDVSVRRFFELAGEGLGRRPRFVPMPIGFARSVMRAAKLIARLAGVRIMSSSAIDFISQDNPFSSERARRELGWSAAVRPEIGVPDAFRWWSEQQ